MSKYSAASDGKGNVKVFRTDSGVLSYSINKGSKTKINNVQVSGDALTVTSTNEYGVIKADVYKDINKGILSYSNIIGHEERESIKKSTSTVSSPVQSTLCQPTYNDVSNSDSGGDGVVYIFGFFALIALFLAFMFPMFIGTIVIGFIIYYMFPWICKIDNDNDFDIINMFISTYLFLYVYRDMQHNYPSNIPLHGWEKFGYYSSIILMSGFIVYGTKRIIDNIVPSIYMFLGLTLIFYRINYISINNIAVKLFNWTINLINLFI